jgi:hypothetical protein
MPEDWDETELGWYLVSRPSCLPAAAVTQLRPLGNAAGGTFTRVKVASRLPTLPTLAPEIIDARQHIALAPAEAAQGCP